MNLSLTLCMFTLVSVVALAFTFLHLPGNTMFWQALQNSGHSIVFAILASIVVVIQLRERARSSLKITLFTFASLGALGLLIELAQHLTGRGATAHDLLFNTAGIIAGCSLSIFFLQVFRRSAGRNPAYFLCIAGCAAMVWSLYWPTVYLLTGAMRPVLPVLVDFENPGARYFLRGKRSKRQISSHEEWTSNQSRSLKVRYAIGRWPGVQFLEPEQDWSSFSSMAFRVFNPSDNDVKISIRVDDRTLGHLDDDHMTVRQTISVGESQVVIDFEQFKEDANRRERQGRATFKQINAFMIFLSGNDKPRTLYFDDFVLR